MHSREFEMRKAKLAHNALNGVRRGLDNRPRRIDHFGVKKHRSAAHARMPCGAGATRAGTSASTRR